MKERVKYILKHNAALLLAYRLLGSFFFRFVGCFLKTDPSLMLFTANSGGYNDSPREIYRVVKTDPRFANRKIVWALDDVGHFDPELDGCRLVKLDSIEYFVVALKAKYWIASVNIERGLHFKKKGTVFLNTWHGAAINKMGNGVRGRSDFDCSNVDYFCYSGEYERELLIRDMGVLPGNLFASGLPKNDALYAPDPRRVAAIREALGVPHDKRVILYAPTWRDSDNGGVDYNFDPPITWGKWRDALGSDYVVLVRMHPNTTCFKHEGDSCFIDCSKYPEVNDLLIVADVLVSDYSSIILDFCVLNRPIFCFGYDYDEYLAARGFYYDLKTELPNGVIEHEDELLESIARMDSVSQKEKAVMFHSSHIEYGGNATAMCVDALS